MKSIRKRLNLISLFMAFLVLFVSCEQYNDYDNISVPVENKLTGKEIFKSLFFGNGNLVNKISVLEKQSQLENFSNEEIIEFEKNMKILLSEIELNSPNFFSSFESKITSNQHQLIEEAINEGTKEVLNNVHVIIPNFSEILSTVQDDIKQNNMSFDTSIETSAIELKSSKYDDLLDKNIVSSSNELGCTLILACALAVALYAVVAVHNTVAVAANVYLVFALWGPSLDKHKGDGGSSSFVDDVDDTLREEMLVEEIANIQW